MNIENKYVEIKIGDKIFRKHNFYLNSYLKLFSKCQILKNDDEENAGKIYLSNSKKKDFSNQRVYIKLDTPLIGINIDSTLSSESFELSFINGSINKNGNKNGVNVQYNFSNEISYIYNNEEQTDRSLLNGHRIMAISFGLYTYLDVSEYDLVFKDGEIVTISREDIFNSNAICDGYSYPIHLSPSGADEKEEYFSGGGTALANVYAYVYSVGLGYNIGKMEEEYVVGIDSIPADIKLKEEDDYTFSFVLSKAVDTGIFPGSGLYPSTNTYPKTFRIKVSNYPSDSLYPRNSLYPTFSDYKYVIVKYRKFYIERHNYVTFLDEYYTMSYYTSKEGILTIKNKIERNDNNE